MRARLLAKGAKALSFVTLVRAKKEIVFVVSMVSF